MLTQIETLYFKNIYNSNVNYEPINQLATYTTEHDSLELIYSDLSKSSIYVYYAHKIILSKIITL